ncbi:PREDICTED: protein O-mannosyl-transferase 2-like isoform X2 [Amphimedon queenslandica]|uniref:Protein O-mannosyl-transferase 2 n=1 Tax=Amphimedon queenslandica TaxID=400682 RepID=A0A1X7VLU6_AMPQE|nr:PREDICTED: protein O-mannosyl-transferase 2-like isoform X2 [Amphimedon queenslandica]|eukprot:XP_019864301.1 PREDICTED: protein O-mannosyl-transferase 2-like isoform X2 [Amphimedon queenslandica]
MADIEDSLTQAGETDSIASALKELSPSPKKDENKGREQKEDSIEPIPPRLRLARRLSSSSSPIYSPSFNQKDWPFFTCLALVTVLSFATRLYTLNEPQHVAWDETHFGKHASWYIQGKFFFDVHPPLGKLIIATAGVLSGYNGSFEFKEPGQKYEDTPYYGMRLGCVLFGIFLVPLAFLTVWELVHSLSASVIAATMILCETGTLTLSQYILLDPPLMFFVMASTYCAVKFQSYKEEPYTLEWWYFLVLTGIFLACTFSVKWVGLFVILLVGLMTIKDLWDILGDLRISMVDFMKQFMCRALCLILLPFLIYISIFELHFIALRYSGNGDGFFSSEFQATLVGNELYDQKVPEFLGYDAVITLKNHRGGGGLLHSHSHLYPEEMAEIRQQQVTAYSHKDDNNKWLVKRANDTNFNASDEYQLVKNGDWIVLEHVSTKRNLHSHNIDGPITKSHKQVSCYGQDGVGDANDFWEVDIVGAKQGDPVRTVASRLRFRHVAVGCYLHSHSKQLPKWGWEQLEVTCNPYKDDSNNLWNVEGNVNPKLPNISFEFYKPGFFSKLIESHQVMAESNNNMKPKEGEQTSQPWHWPLTWQGQLFSGGDYRVYLLGNPIIFWGCDVLLILFVLFVLMKLVADQRSVNYLSISVFVNRFVSSGCFLILGWALHYLPFYLMGRVLYFHHYFPALMFIVMLGAIVIDSFIKLITCLISSRVKSFFFFSAFTLVMSVLIGSFATFMPLSYGMSGSKSDNPESRMYGLKWLPHWDI